MLINPKKYEAKIECDTNDADYVTRIITVADDEVIELPKIFSYSGVVHEPIHGYTPFEILKILAESCLVVKQQSHKFRHNWYRPEFDDIDDCLPLLKQFAKIVYEVDIESLEHPDPDNDYMDEFEEFHFRDKAMESLIDLIDLKFLPSTEFGVHTISKISISPIDATQVLYDERL